jgi:hypothetical protein
MDVVRKQDRNKYEMRNVSTVLIATDSRKVFMRTPKGIFCVTDPANTNPVARQILVVGGYLPRIDSDGITLEGRLPFNTISHV